MEKSAGQQVPEILGAARTHLIKLSNSNVKLAEERDAARHELHVMKVALRMEERGLDPTTTFDEKVAALRAMPAPKLASTEDAVEIAAGGVRLTKLSEAQEAGSAATTSTELDDFVLNQGFTA